MSLLPSRVDDKSAADESIDDMENIVVMDATLEEEQEVGSDGEEELRVIEVRGAEEDEVVVEEVTTSEAVEQDISDVTL